MFRRTSDILLLYGCIGGAVYAAVALADAALRNADPSSAGFAALIYACAGVAATSCIGLAVARRKLRGHLRGHAVSLVLVPLPLTLVYAVIEYNRVVLVSYNIYSWVSIVTTTLLVGVVASAALALARFLDRRFLLSMPTLHSPWSRTALGVVWVAPFIALWLANEPASAVPRRPTTGEPPRDAPNVVIFVSDCLRADHVSIDGYERPTTPTFDRIAREGVRFTDAQAAASWTLPSVVGLLTSAPPGIELSPGGLSSRVAVTTLSEVLMEHGYATYGASNNPHLSGPFGLRDRMQDFDDGGSHVAEALDATVLGNLRQRVSIPRDADIVREVRRHLASLPEPYFVYIHLMGGHSPYELPSGVTPAFPIPPADREITGPYAGMEYTDAELANLIGRYDALVRHTDDLFGTVVDQLEAQRQLDHTLVIYTGDHGEAFGEHGDWGHGRNLHTETVHVPLAMRLPGRVGRATRTELVSLLDVAPTILGLIGGMEAPPTFRGIDLRIHESAGSSPLLVPSELGPALRAAITNDWTYVVNVRDGTESLFDRRTDAGETIDVAEGEPAATRDMREGLARYLDGHESAVVPIDIEVSPDIAEHLEALGYTDHGPSPSE